MDTGVGSVCRSGDETSTSFTFSGTELGWEVSKDEPFQNVQVQERIQPRLQEGCQFNVLLYLACRGYPKVVFFQFWIHDLVVGSNLRSLGHHISASCQFVAFVHDSNSEALLAAYYYSSSMI